METILIGTALQTYPYVYEEKGVVCGLEADYVREICRQAGFEVVFVEHRLNEPGRRLTDEGGLLHALTLPEPPYDLAMNALSAHYTRRTNYLFTARYFNPQHILITKKSELQVEELDEYGFPTDRPRPYLGRRLRIGTFDGFLMDNLHHVYRDPQNVDLVAITGSIEDALLRDEVDLILAWTGVDKAIQRQDSQFFILSQVPIFDADELEGIALAAAQNNPRMKAVVERLNEAILRSRIPDGGEHKRLCEKYLGVGVDIWPASVKKVGTS